MKILNFGSLNIDYTYKLHHIVQPGETISSTGLEVFPGGKGLNQSIALAKAGANVFHAGIIGKDGLFLKNICEKSGVKTDYLKVEDKAPTGNAIIQVSEKGENSIILFPGANRYQTKEFIDSVLANFGSGDMLLLQNEINLLDHLIAEGDKIGMTIVLNPSPFDDNVKSCDLKKVDLFLLNELEGSQLTKETKPVRILEKMKEMYPKAETVLTLGEKGSVYGTGGKQYFQDAVKMEAVDTTAAGDTYTGFLLAALMKNKKIETAMKEAAYAAALAVSRKGASVSIPKSEEVDKIIKKWQAIYK